MPKYTSKRPKKKHYPNSHSQPITLNKTPNIDFGQLASSLCFELAKKLNQKPLVLAEKLVAAVETSSFDLIEKIAPAGAGYINFHVNFPKFTTLTLASIKQLNYEFGSVKTDNPLKIIVEHTKRQPPAPDSYWASPKPHARRRVGAYTSTKGAHGFSPLLH